MVVRPPMDGTREWLDEMEEVIFAGTTTRPAHRVAEVELTFDNSERRLPLEARVVTPWQELGISLDIVNEFEHLPGTERHALSALY